MCRLEKEFERLFKSVSELEKKKNRGMSKKIELLRKKLLQLRVLKLVTKEVGGGSESVPRA